MDIVYLPYLEWNDTLHTAVQRMKATGSHWVVVWHQDSQYQLHPNRAVLQARSQGVELCAGLRDFPGQPLALLDDLLAQNQAASLEALIEAALDQKGALYGLPFWPYTGNQLIAVATRHETLGDEVRSTQRVCGCERGHEFSEPPPVDGTSCRHDGTRIDCY